MPFILETLKHGNLITHATFDNLCSSFHINSSLTSSIQLTMRLLKVPFKEDNNYKLFRVIKKCYAKKNK